MGIQGMVIIILSLAIPMIVSCNLEGDVLHAQRANWADPNNVLQSWDPTLVNPCTWFHVTCNGDNSVIRVDLGNAGLSGSLIPQLGMLANLQYLELFENRFTGKIPAALGNLTSLVSLGLEHNRLRGPIPSSLGNIKTLKYLTLNGNLLSGAVPTEILDLVLNGNLIRMNVSDNRLAGRMRSSQPIVTLIIQDPKTSN